MAYQPPVWSGGQPLGKLVRLAGSWCDECGADIPVVRSAILIGRYLMQAPDGLGLCEECELGIFNTTDLLSTIPLSDIKVMLDIESDQE